MRAEIFALPIRGRAIAVKRFAPRMPFHRFAPNTHSPCRRLAHSPFRLSLDGDAFCKIARLVDVATELDREVIGKELEGNDG